MTQEGFDNQGPFLQAAFLCEQILDEKDGVKSAIRIIDRITRQAVGPNPPEEMEPFDYETKMLIKFKSGRARGPMRLQLRLQRPSGDSPPPTIQTVYFEGEDDRGVDIVGTMKFRFEVPGLYWLNVELDGVQITRMPLRVIYLPQVTQIPPGAEGPPPQEQPPDAS